MDTSMALGCQTRKDFEIIFVDDGSTDMSTKLITQFSKQSSLPVKLIRQDNFGPAKARNKGVEGAAGEILLFLDSDCIPLKNWVEEMACSLNRDVVGCYCGNKVKNKKSLIARYVDYEMTRRHEGMVGKNIDAISTYSAGFLKKAFTESGGFSTQYREASGEDFDLTFNMVRAGYKLKFVTTTLVYQYHPSSLREYLYKQFRRGYWRVKLYLRNKDKIIKRDTYTGHELKVQFLLSLLAFLSIPLAALYPISILLGFGILLLSNLSFGIWAFKKEKKFLFILQLMEKI